MSEPANPSLAASLLRASARAYATAIVAQLSAGSGGLADLPPDFAQPVDDTEVRIRQLAEAVAVARPALFAHVIAWYKVAFHHRAVPAGYLPANLAALAKTLRAELPPMAWAAVAGHLTAASAHLAEAPVDLPSHLTTASPHGELAARFLLAILEARGDDAFDLVRTALDGGVAIADVHDHVLVPVQRETGRMWLMGEITVADEHFGSAVVDRVLWHLHDRLPRPAANAPFVLTMGVGGDLHGIGLRIVSQRLRLAGYAVHELGCNMPAGDIEWALRDRRVELVAIAATMLLHLHTLAQTIAHIRHLAKADGGDGRRPAVLVGGEPFARAPDLHALLGADAGATSAGQAVAAAQRLLAR